MKPRHLRRSLLAAGMAASLLGTMSSVACHTRVKTAVSLALTDYVYSLLDPANLVELFEEANGEADGN